MKPAGHPGTRRPRIVEITADGVAVPRGAARLARFCSRALQAAGYSTWEVGIMFCGDERITALNTRYRGKTSATDVLSFPADEGSREEPVRGDIAVSLPALARNAAAYEVSEDEEMKRLLVHGLLHLAGMDHGRGKGGTMLALQEELLEKLGTDKIFRQNATGYSGRGEIRK
jgi:probable rRNA maturation factor